MKPLELETYFDKFLEKFWNLHDARNKPLPDAIPFTISKNAQSNAAGALAFEVWKNNQDQVFDITRCLVVSDTTTPAAPYTNAAAYLWFSFGAPNSFTPASVFDFAPKVAGQQLIPYANNFSKDTDPLLHPNETISLVGVVAANVNITCTLSGYLKKKGSFH